MRHPPGRAGTFEGLQHSAAGVAGRATRRIGQWEASLYRPCSDPTSEFLELVGDPPSDSTPAKRRWQHCGIGHLLELRRLALPSDGATAHLPPAMRLAVAVGVTHIHPRIGFPPLFKKRLIRLSSKKIKKPWQRRNRVSAGMALCAALCVVTGMTHKAPNASTSVLQVGVRSRKHLRAIDTRRVE